jgi:hypothetical protein
MKREDLIETLVKLGYTLVQPARPKVSESRVLAVLDEVAGSTEPRIIEGFPVVLASCAQRGIKVDPESLLSRYPPNTQRRRDLERLVLLSLDLLESEGLEKPGGLDKVMDGLRSKYGYLLDSDAVALESGTSLSTGRLRTTLKRYASNLTSSESARKRERDRQLRSFQVSLHLSTLFPQKQKELVLKKLQGEPLTKTEQEYFSRVVRKKLEALADTEVRRIAVALTKR